MRSRHSGRGPSAHSGRGKGEVGQFICRYRKRGQLRWISHLDLKRTFERAMRRARLPLVLTRGHNPHPKLSFGPPLPLGVTSDVELLAIRLSEAMEAGQLKDRLNGQLPDDLEVVETWAVPAYRKKETFGDIEVAQYEVVLKGNLDAADLRTRLETVLGRRELIVQRGGERPERTVDLRPLIFSLEVVGSAEDEMGLRMRLRTGSHGGARPQEVTAVLGLDEEKHVASYHRSGLSALARPFGRSRAAQTRAWKQAQIRKGGNRRT